MTIKRGGIDRAFAHTPAKAGRNKHRRDENTARKARGLSAHNQLVKAKEWRREESAPLLLLGFGVLPAPSAAPAALAFGWFGQKRFFHGSAGIVKKLLDGIVELFAEFFKIEGFGKRLWLGL